MLSQISANVQQVSQISIRHCNLSVTLMTESLQFAKFWHKTMMWPEISNFCFPVFPLQKFYLISSLNYIHFWKNCTCLENSKIREWRRKFICKTSIEYWKRILELQKIGVGIAENGPAFKWIEFNSIHHFNTVLKESALKNLNSWWRNKWEQ